MILYDSPAVKGPKLPTAIVCLGCLKKVDGQTTCPKCRWPMCSTQCSNGETHQRECEILASTSEQVVSFVRGAECPLTIFEGLNALLQYLRG